MDTRCRTCGKTGRLRFGAYCTRECMAAGFSAAPSPSHPVDVIRHDGPGYRWACAGCHRRASGHPARRDGNRWYCGGCMHTD